MPRTPPSWWPFLFAPFAAACGLVPAKTLPIDGGWSCEATGSGQSFNPADKIFVLGNRCQHHANQQAIARFRNLRVWVGIY